jgi:SP family arabinose:H+ symporter-like MFS transporter
MSLSRTTVTATIVAASGGLLFGFDTAVISGITDAITRAWNLDPNGLGITVAAALAGTILGAMFAGYPGDRIGRRDSLRIMAILYLVSAIGCAFAWNWASLVIFRFIGGLGIGGSSVLGPMYIAEISPAKERGRLVGFFQVNVVAGILVAYLSNYVIGTFGLGDHEWRWKLGIAAIPAGLFFGMLFSIPRSPRWLVSKGRIAEARAVLKRIGEEDLESAISSMSASVEHDRSRGRETLFARQHRLPVFLAISIGMFNQLSGINAILYYLNDIFAKAGFTRVSSDLQSVAIGATNLAFTLLAMSVIDRIGRRSLLITGSIGTGICLAGVAAVFASGAHENLLVWLLIGFIAFFAFSQGAVIWVYLSEVFPNRVRAKGQSLGSFTHWAMNALVSWAFPVLAANSRAIPFVFFSAMMFLQLFVVLFVYPETKGVPLEEIERKLEPV